MNNAEYKPTILIVDDVPDNIEVLSGILRPSYRVLASTSGQSALRLLEGGVLPDLILLDVMMPGMDGYETCRAIKANPRTLDIPVIFVTARGEETDEERGFSCGAVDYLTKPVKPRVALARVSTHLSHSRLQHQLESLVAKRTEELYDTRLQIIRTLARAAEFKDNETGMHVVRMSKITRLLASSLDLDSTWVDLLYNAAPMHDIGKIGIPDSILLKPGKLTDDELAIMRTHAEIGARIIGAGNGALLQLAANVALTHHEKWDGSGYPHGLKGTDIPLEGRLVAIADVFDALTSVRPYKKAWPLSEALAWIEGASGSHFEPDLVTAFMKIAPQAADISLRYQDLPSQNTGE